MHKLIRLQLPDLRVLPVRADFSVTVFAAVCKLCKDLGTALRYSDENHFHSSLQEFAMPRNYRCYTYRKSRTSPTPSTVELHHVVGGTTSIPFIGTTPWASPWRTTHQRCLLSLQRQHPNFDRRIRW